MLKAAPNFPQLSILRVRTIPLVMSGMHVSRGISLKGSREPSHLWCPGCTYDVVLVLKVHMNLPTCDVRDARITWYYS